MGWAEPKKIYIGIDTGTNTGVAVWDSEAKSFIELKTLTIIKAMELVKHYHSLHTVQVRVEDARKSKKRIRGAKDIAEAKAKMQGVGSVKRDAAVWETFLKENNIDYMMIAPNARLTKWDKEKFYKYTKYTGNSSGHSRDAGMRVYGL